MERITWIVGAVALVVGAGIGIAVGTGIGSGGSGGEPILTGAVPGPDAAAPVPGSPGSAAPAGGTANPGVKKDDLLDRVLAELPPPDLSSGDGVIRGTVKTGDGTPVSGVLIRATRKAKDDSMSAWRFSGAPPPDEGIETDIRRSIEWYRNQRAFRREARTDPEGAYTLTGIADASYYLQAYKEGYNFESPSHPERVRPGSVVDFKATPLVEVPVDVVLPGGTRPAKARILVSENRGPSGYERWTSSRRDWSPDCSILWITPGSYSLVAETGGEESDEGGNLRSAPLEIALEAGKLCPCVVLNLREAVGIRGKVILPSDWQVDSMRVHCMSLPQGQAPDLEKLRSEGKADQVNGADGFAFTFKDLAPGSYLVGVSFEWKRIAASTVVTVSDRMAEADLTVPSPDPKDCVVVRAVSPELRPVLDLEFQTLMRSGGGSRTAGTESIRRQDGSYLVFFKDMDNGGGGEEKDDEAETILTVTSKKYGKKEVAIVPGASREIEIRFQEPALLEATVEGYSGSGHEGKLVLELLPKAKREEGFPSRIYPTGRENGMDAEGRQTLGPVEPGEYDLVLKMSKGGRDRWWQAWTVQRTPMHLPAGITKTSVRIPPLYALTVILEKEGSGTTVHLGLSKAGGSPEAVSFRQEKTGKDKRVTFDLLPPGEYVIRVWEGGARGQMNVAVSGPSVVTFEPQVMNALKVSLSDPQGLLGKAGFLEGDLIVGVDGKEFKNEAEMQLFIGAAMSNKEAKFIVLRNGSRLEVKMDPSSFMGGPGRLGGNFEPTTR